MAAREAYSLYVERAVEGANEADGPFSSLWEPHTRSRSRWRTIGSKPRESMNVRSDSTRATDR